MKVLLVEDSPSVRAYVEGVLRAAPDIEVLPSAPDGAAGVERALKSKPDVILMDLELPLLDGIAAIRQIMAITPCPIVVLSAQVSSPERDRTFEAFDAGAVEVLSKPAGLTGAAITSFRVRLLRTVRVMREAQVLRRRASSPSIDLTGRAREPFDLISSPDRYDIVVIGGSTGAPEVIARLLREIPKPFRLPIVVAQHIIPGFERGFAAWLSGTGHKVAVVQAGDRIRPGMVHIAPADTHLSVRPGWFELVPREGGTPTPSVDVLFKSTAVSFGARSVALLLSGMGADGSSGMLSLRKSGSLTLAQAGESCVIDGMPKAARALSASVRDLSPALLSKVLQRLMP